MKHRCVLLTSIAAIGLLISQARAPILLNKSPTVQEAISAESVDRAVERGLHWLASRQSAKGSWMGDVGHKRGDGYLVFNGAAALESMGSGHVGVTALAGLAFLANGHVPERGPLAHIVERVTDYLLGCGDAYDYLTDGGTRMYSHAFAVLFLAQVHGMTQRRAEELEDKLRRATDFIVHAQNRYGAWRYTPGTPEADLSVTVCQVQALRAARNVGIHVSRASIDRVIDYIRGSRIQSGPYSGAFYYKIYGRAASTKTSFAINAAAVTALHSAGVYDEQEYGRALLYLEDGYSPLSRSYPHHYYYWYGNYYAAQALWMEGGARFDRYWQRLASDLLRRQREDGSWQNDVGPGDAFATAVACLLLRVPLGYLPIFQR